MASSGSISGETLEILKKVSTGMVADALVMAGIEGGMMGVRPARGFEDAKVVGPAATVLFAPPRPDTPTLSNYQAIRATPPGCVLVIDAKGVDSHFMGDVTGECAKRQGLTGIVVYGGSRDIAGFREIGMPLYCTGSATRNRPSNLKATAYNVPVEIGGVLVKPGDIIVADEDGVVAVPAEALAIVMRNLETISRIEAGQREAVRRDAPLEEIVAFSAAKKFKG